MDSKEEKTAFVEHILCARHCARYFTFEVSFIFHEDLWKKVLLLPLNEQENRFRVVNKFELVCKTFFFLFFAY